MYTLLRLYRTFNLLSVDVVVGAVISSLFFSSLLDVKPNKYSLAALGLTVWIIYTADRLLDVRNLKGQAITDRHKFHQYYQNQLWTLIILIGMVVMMLTFSLEKSVLVGGVFLAAFVGTYLRVQKKLRVKEFVIAFLYTAGVLLPSLGLDTDSLDSESYVMIAQFFILVMINLLLFSWFEYETDKSSGYSSVVTVFGKKVTICVLFMLIFSSLSITGWLLIQNSVNLKTFIFLFMTLILLIIALFPPYFSTNSRYRLLGDAIFFLPLLALVK